MLSVKERLNKVKVTPETQQQLKLSTILCHLMSHLDNRQESYKQTETAVQAAEAKEKKKLFLQTFRELQKGVDECEGRHLEGTALLQ